MCYDRNAKKMAAWKPKLNALVAEYLSEVGLSESLSVFEAECKEKGQPIGDTSSELSRNVKEAFIVAFDCGEREAFFDAWEELVPMVTRTHDTVGRDLELSLCVHFALYPLKYQTGDAVQAMETFKTYLSSKGGVLAQCQEFAIYCALPYIPNPASHSSFSHLFTEAWSSGLKTQLQKFLATALPSSNMATKASLTDIYAQSQISPRQHQGKEQALEKRVSDIKRCYDTLASISIELIEALEAAVAGELVNPEYIQNMCSRLSSTIPTVSSSHTWSSDVPILDKQEPNYDVSRLRESVMSLTQSVHTPVPEVLWETYQLLDYPHLKQDLLLLSDRTKALILQALRWRVTRSLPGRQRQLVIYHYITNDVLRLAIGNGQTVVDCCLSTQDLFLWEQMCRMLNAFSSLAKGRDYLQSSASLVPHLCALLIAHDGDDYLRQNALGTIQKLSLRRRLQTSMIKEGLVDWVISILGDGDSLSDYTLRYSLALLMNLCLRTAGKRQCVKLSPLPLQVLSELLEHEETEIRSYINGILYSLLGVSELRDTALSLGIVDMIQSAVKDSPPEIQSQLRYIINDRLKSTKIQALPNEDSDDDADEDEEQEDPEMVEGDDGEDAISTDETIGEELLAKYYKDHEDRPRTSSERSQSSLSMVPFMRPVTPRSVTTSTPISSTPKPFPSPPEEEGGGGEVEALRECSALPLNRTYTPQNQSVVIQQSHKENRPHTAD